MSDKPSMRKVQRRVSGAEFMRRLRQARLRFDTLTHEREVITRAGVEYEKHESDWEEPGRTKQLNLDQSMTDHLLHGIDSSQAREFLVRQFERLLWEVEKEMREEQVDITQAIQSFALYEHEMRKRGGR